jgi:DNA-binding CsgD family transcriptional regulator
MTQVPSDDFIRLVSEEIAPDDTDGSVSLLDARAVDEYLDARAAEEQLELRTTVQQRFEAYLMEKKVDPHAVKWLNLYLQGRSQEAIARDLNIEVKQVYRLREKVSYHATKVFATKNQSELVASWLGNTSSKEK